MRAITLAAAGLLLATAAVAGTPGRLVEHAPGAPEVVYEPHPASPVVLIAVAVEAGSARETPMTRGLSHFLEHMLFDGSERFSREEISAWAERNGVFLNAFTRKETVVFFLLAGRELIGEGMEILSQMLLHPVFPPGELEKERGVVLEEMRQGRDDPRDRRARLVARRLYAGSPLAEPVIGHPVTIETISRTALGSWHGERYRPGRMRLVLMGGFETAHARDLVETCFCEAPPRWRTGPRPVRTGSIVPQPRWGGETARLIEPDLDPGLEALLPLPRVDEEDFPVALVAARMLGDAGGPLAGSLREFDLPDPDVSLDVHGGFSALRISIEATPETAVHLEDAFTVVRERLAGWEPESAAVDGARTAIRSAEAFDRERYHYYMMLAGERVALFGDRYLDAADDGVAAVERRDVSRLVRDRLVDPPCNVVVVLSAARAGGPGAEERVSRSVRSLANGAVLGASRRPGSPVFALHLLVRERAWLEHEHGDARFSILGAIIEHSPAGMELESDLGGIGARIAWQDNPFIPMDDYLLSPAWTFVRLEAPVEAAREAVGIFASFLRKVAIDEAAIAAVSPRVRMELGVRAGRPADRLGHAANEALFGDHPYGRGVFPAEAGEFDTADYRDLLEEIRLGGNLVVTATGPAPEDETLDLIEDAFGGFPSGGGGNRNRPIAFEAAARIERQAAIEGVYIRRAWLAADVEAGEAAALRVGAEVLSRRMQEEIRETRGLAYSTGCGASLYPGAVVVSATVGSRADNLAEVTAVLDSLIRSLTTSPPTGEETAAAKSRLRGRLARRHLSSASEAAALGVELFLFPEAVAGNRLAAVDAPAVRDALARRIDPDGGVTVRLLPGEGERPARRMPPPGMPGMR